MSTRRIILWSGPRNVSTALMYSFAQRSDTQVVDEPLYAHYLTVTGAPHPGREVVLAGQDTDGERVVREVILGPSDHPVLFVKNMAHHLIGLDEGFLNRVEHVILTRDPQEMLPSLVNQVPEPEPADTALPQQLSLYHRLTRQGFDVPVLDARKLLLNPEQVLRQLCDRLKLPFEPAMLSWPEGGRREDGPWAPFWYHNVHRSTGFSPYQRKKEPFPSALNAVLAVCQPAYDALNEQALEA